MIVLKIVGSILNMFLLSCCLGNEDTDEKIASVFIFILVVINIIFIWFK